MIVEDDGQYVWQNKYVEKRKKIWKEINSLYIYIYFERNQIVDES